MTKLCQVPNLFHEAVKLLAGRSQAPRAATTADSGASGMLGDGLKGRIRQVLVGVGLSPNRRLMDHRLTLISSS